MKKIYTSCYTNHGDNPNAIGISFIVPKWYTGTTMAKLAPTVDMISRIKSWVQEGEYSELDYTNHYIELLNTRKIDPQELVDEIPDGSILLCYEPAGEFCHRRVLANWIQMHTGIEIAEEYQNYKDIKAEERNKLVDTFIEF